VIHLVLFGLQNRTFGPYLATINRILLGTAGERSDNGEEECILAPFGCQLRRGSPCSAVRSL
jgi:hypothetical protein